MAKRRFLYGLLIAASLSTGLGVALAQNGNEQGENENDQGEDGVEVGAQTRANLSPQEMLSETETAIQTAERLGTRISGMLDEARRENDVMRVNCLDDKLAQMHATQGMLERRRDELSDRAEASDTGGMQHSFTMVAVLRQRVQTLEREANQCIGQDIFETGATRVVSSVALDTPDEQDPGSFPDDPFVAVPVPPVLPVPPGTLTIPPPMSSPR